MADTSTLPQRMLGYKVIKGTIKVETGLHIGGSSDTIEIGGMDNPIIRNPVNKEPFVPGSSLKGKMRSLLEWKLEKVDPDGEPHKWCENEQCPICRIFGTSASTAQLGPTRLIIRDASVSEEHRIEMKKNNPTWTYNDLIEEKTENSINRITARANPRPIQRVVTGTEFDFEIVYRIFDTGDKGDTDRKLFQYVLDGLQLIEMDALGGSGSRGCGKVSFYIETKDGIKRVKDVAPADFE